MIKSQVLDEWVANIRSNGIKQRSPEWVVARGNYIGGSAVATLEQKNPYSSLKKLLREKAGLERTFVNIAMNWGTIFEDVLCKYVEKINGLQVVGSDIFVTAADKPMFAYSPDGLAVDSQNRIVLMEFKCPWKREPNNIVPSHYVSQVKMGLAMIEIADIGMYVEGIFRRCSIDQMKMAHDDESRTGEVCAFGYMEFTSEFKYDYKYDDISEAGWSSFSSIINRAAGGEFGIRAHIFYSDDEYRAHKPSESQEDVIGKMCWKLLRVDTHYIEREPGYLDKLSDLAASILADSRQINGSEEEYEKIKDRY